MSEAKEGHSALTNIVMALIFIALCGVAMWDTTNMADPDSYVFPRAVATALIVFSVMLILYSLLRPGRGGRDLEGGEVQKGGNTPRRVALVGCMLGTAFLMPVLGFLPAGLLSFGALMLSAMYDPWTRFRLIVYPIAGVAIVAGFYLLFSKAFLVPLPEGIFFD
ncbi:MAG: tripartite tricarboxylate transporter TctB family protein [Rhodobacterales bacterium]|nr:tripartite tricarboxylate transporter TctB family protein [Rhodobacterales bacterium]